VPLSNPSPLIQAARDRTWTGDLLDGVNVTAPGPMAGVTWRLVRGAIGDVLTALVAIVARSCSSGSD